MRRSRRVSRGTLRDLFVFRSIGKSGLAKRDTTCSEVKKGNRRVRREKNAQRSQRKNKRGIYRGNFITQRLYPYSPESS